MPLVGPPVMTGSPVGFCQVEAPSTIVAYSPYACVWSMALSSTSTEKAIGTAVGPSIRCWPMTAPASVAAVWSTIVMIATAAGVSADRLAGGQRAGDLSVEPRARGDDQPAQQREDDPERTRAIDGWARTGHGKDLRASVEGAGRDPPHPDRVKPSRPWETRRSIAEAAGRRIRGSAPAGPAGWPSRSLVRISIGRPLRRYSSPTSSRRGPGRCSHRRSSGRSRSAASTPGSPRSPGPARWPACSGT